MQRRETRSLGKTTLACVAAVVLTLGAANAGPRELRLAHKGEARCAIVVPPGSMAWEGSSNVLNRWSPPREEAERRKRLQRYLVQDLALYLGKMSGANIEIVEGLPAGEKRIPVYIGAEARKVFGPVGKSKARLFGFRVVAGKKGVGLYGESEYGTSYAIYELLHRLGCRWYMPSELGECIPQSSELALPEMDESLAPAAEWRRMENRTVDPDFRKYVVPEKTRWHEKGSVIDAFSGYCQPAQFDVTAAVKAGANQITILCERNWLNELGTGALVGPAVVCREK